MPHFKFPSHCVYWTQVKDHENIKSKLLPIIHSLTTENNYDNPFKACTMKTNISKMTDFIDNETKDKLVSENLIKMISETNCFPEKKPTETLITEYWFNVYEKGDFQEMHNHNTVPKVVDGKRYDDIFSVIYILHEEESTPVLFRLDNTEIPFYPMKHIINFETSRVDGIKEGTILIFSSHLNHTVFPVKQSGRTTIAFNIVCSFE
jgi:hypothetical protein